MVDYTVVIGVDDRHLDHLQAVWPTWMRHKPSLKSVPLVVFYSTQSGDREFEEELEDILAEHPDVRFQKWPPNPILYAGTPGDRWTDPQRHKMLAGFVHVPAHLVETEYWLKLDLDVVAIGQDDWIDDRWFEDRPAIVSQKWHYFKPPDKIESLDQWVKRNSDRLKRWSKNPPLNLRPNPGSNLVKHPCIISWCAFFQTEFTRICSHAIENTCGKGILPFPSQDGVLWYMAIRGGWRSPRRVNMRARGWKHRGRLKSVIQTAREAMDEGVEA